MNPLKEYSIPIRGLNPGEHDYVFQLDRRFFREFEDSPVEDANLHVDFILDKHSDHFVAEIGLHGTVHVKCDRCLADVDMPVESTHYLIVKYGEELEDEAEVVYISREATEWNVAQILYEYSLLALPITNTFECEEMDPVPCDADMLARLSTEDDEAPESSSENPIWEELKKSFGKS